MAGRLVGLGGYAESGKDAFTDFLEELRWARTYMSYDLEHCLLDLNPWVNVNWDNWKVKSDGTSTWPRDEFITAGFSVGVHYMRYRDLHAIVGYDRSKNNNDVRDYLQKLGTEVGRRRFGESCWTDLAFARVDEQLADGFSVAITGIRFPNELHEVRRRNGLLVWVSRAGFGPVNTHSSDNTLGAEDFDIVVNNNGTLEDLRESAKWLDEDEAIWEPKNWQRAA